MKRIEAVANATLLPYTALAHAVSAGIGRPTGRALYDRWQYVLMPVCAHLWRSNLAVTDRPTVCIGHADSMYVPCSVFRRTPLERFDQDLAWHRDDQWFFAAGACHILAYAFLEQHSGRFAAFGLWPQTAADPSHVFACDGLWAFDHCGWTPAIELLEVSQAVEPHADYHSRPIAMGLDEFCARHWHRSRAEFIHDPWRRARAYIARFDHINTR